MVCPNCGAEIKEGCVYCGQCGEAIQIVPDFEPEIQERIDETLSAIVDNVMMAPKTEELPEIPELTEQVQVQTQTQTQTQKAKPFSHVVMVIAVLLAVVFVVIVYRNTTYSSYLQKARAFVAAGDFESAIPQFERAIRRDDSEIGARLEEASAYRMTGNDDAALRRLYEVIELDDGCQEAYESIITIYEQRRNYLAINNLLESCQNQSIYEVYKEYLALPPEFSEEEGTYDRHLTLKLMTDNAGTIYYTLDGSEPTKESFEYTTPLELQRGKNVIRAIFVNEKGIVSDSVSKIYEIDILKPDAPVVIPSSGGFISPEYITVTFPEDCEVYYTTDGTTPSESSLKYDGKLPMPIGNSHFKFVAKSKDNLVSDVVDASYVLNFVGACTEEEAANYVTASLVATGRLISVDGTSMNRLGKYKYECDSAARNASRIYYMIHEIYVDTDGTQERTNQYYAVDAYSLVLYQAKRDENGDFAFELFQ